jgi:pyridoxine kinase
MLQQPRVLVLTDLPVVGNVAGRVALPALVSESCLPQLLPTCLVTGHGAFKGTQVFANPAFFLAALAHMSQLNPIPDWLLSGFFPNASSIDTFISWLDSFNHPLPPLTIDPVMADNGKLYQILSPEIVPAMTRLLGYAQVLTPNVTEAALLLGLAASTRPANRQEAQDWLQSLANFGPSTVVLTSLDLADRPDTLEILSYHRPSQSFDSFTSPKLGHSIPGAGDYYAAVLTGALARGLSTAQALAQAWRRLQQAVSNPPRYFQEPDGRLVPEGIAFEAYCPTLSP